MLRLHPDRRAKASELIHHNFLDGIVVQGEIDVIRRMEQEEAEKRKQCNAANNEQPMVEEARSRDKLGRKDILAVAALDQSERDAMKPVDDGSIVGEDGLEPHYEDESRTAAQQYQHQHNNQSQYQPPLLHAPPQASGAQKTPRPLQEKQRSGMRS